MNKPLFYMICTFSVGCFIIVWLFIYGGMNAADYKEPQTNPPIQEKPIPKIPSKDVTSTTLSHYLLIAENEKISVYAVYSNGDKKLYDTLDVNINTLRETDKNSFIQGMIIHDENELSHIIEDYVS